MIIVHYDYLTISQRLHAHVCRMYRKLYVGQKKEMYSSSYDNFIYKLYPHKLSFLFFDQIPIALLISQLEKDIDGHAGLMRFSEVVNLFHEFGHVV